MLKRKTLPLLVLLLLFLSGCGARMDRQSEFLQYKDEGEAGQIEGMLAEFVGQQRVPGISVGILKNDQVRFFNHGSTAADGTAVSEETQFEIGTMSQIFTGHVFGEYVFRGYLSPETPIHNYYPYLTLPMWQDGTAPTSGQVATHRSGFAAAPGNLPETENPYADYDELALRRYLSTTALENRPGTVYNPKGMDMGLLGFLLKTTLKQDFEALVKYSIMYRIGMTKTTISMTEEQEAARAMPHDADGNPVSIQEYDALSGIGGMAGFKSSAFDLINYATVHMNRFPIEAELWAELESDAPGARQKALGKMTVEQRMTAALTVATAEQYSQDGASIGYGYSLGEINGQKYVWQRGESLGYGAYLGIVPGTGTAVVVLVNGAVDVGLFGEEILKVIQ